MSDESRAATINKLSIRYGLIIGVISIVLTLIFWVIDPLMQYTNSWVSFLVFVLMIVLLVVFGIETRKAAGGYWTFGEAFKSLLLMSVIVSILTAVFNYILFAFIDPTLSQRVSEAVITKLNDQLSSSGISQDKIDEMSKSVEGKLQPSITNMGVNLGIGLVIYAVIDLIIAAIIKKNPPLFAPVDDDVTV